MRGRGALATAGETPALLKTPALLCWGERCDEENAEGCGVTEFAPPQLPDGQRCGFLDEIEPSAKQERRESQGSDWGNNTGKTGHREYRRHQKLPGSEGPSAF